MANELKEAIKLGLLGLADVLIGKDPSQITAGTIAIWFQVMAESNVSAGEWKASCKAWLAAERMFPAPADILKGVYEQRRQAAMERAGRLALPEPTIPEEQRKANIAKVRAHLGQFVGHGEMKERKAGRNG